MKPLQVLCVLCVTNNLIDRTEYNTVLVAVSFSTLQISVEVLHSFAIKSSEPVGFQYSQKLVQLVCRQTDMAELPPVQMTHR